MKLERGDIWLADLNPIRGSEQAGIRPVLIFQNNAISKYSSTVLAIPLTTNLRRAALPSCMSIPAGEGGLKQESVALGHQLRVLDQSRLLRKLGTIRPKTMASIENVILFTLGYS